MKEKTLECICHRATGLLALLVNLLEVMRVSKSDGKLGVTEVDVWHVKQKKQRVGENYIMV
jgi:hypothetical protein